MTRPSSNSEQIKRAPAVHPDYLKHRLDGAVAATEHFSALLKQDRSRIMGLNRCLARYSQSVDTLKDSRDIRALAAVEECQNELCVAEELVQDQDHQFSLIEYEPDLQKSDQRIDFRATNNPIVWFVEVKTIHPEFKDRGDQYDEIVKSGRVSDNVTIGFERDWLGGELWHNKFSARSKMAEHALEFEDRIAAAELQAPDHRFVLALFTDGFCWHEDELEDFVAFYQTGHHRLDDGLGKMERHALEEKGRGFMRTISQFAYFERRPFSVSPNRKNWNVRPPQYPW
jgi:hypothetical protein